MKCAWQAFINLLPEHIRFEVEKLKEKHPQELRIRTGLQPELIFQQGAYTLSHRATREDITFIINIASQYSPWNTQTIREGYITAPGGHRIGICGISAVSENKILNISTPTSLCIRVASDYEGIAKSIENIKSSLLIIGPPGSGKTTLLRDFIRCKSECVQGNISVIDEREEIFPVYNGQACFYTGRHTDVLSKTNKATGIEAVLRSMNPEWIAVDEITGEKDCEALLHAGWCGVNLVATAHAGSIIDLKSRPVYRPLIEKNLFPNILILRRDKSWTMERISS